MSAVRSTSRRSNISFHHGETLCRVAGTYPTLREVVMEIVQNALDSDAKQIGIRLDRARRRITVEDNGNGVSRNFFDVALQSVCSSVKSKDKLGQFGIGLVSPVGKCRYFTFLSRCPETGEYSEWRFVTSKIKEQRDNLTIPVKKRPELLHQGDAKKRGRRSSNGVVAFNTRVDIRDFSTDRTISRIDNINQMKDDILERFSAVIRRKGVKVTIEFTDEDGDRRTETFTAEAFTGKPLTEVTYAEKDAGDVEFKLYIARKTTKGRKGKVTVGTLDNEFRFPFGDFSRSAAGLLPGEVRKALTSGIFEGEILCQKVTLNPSRNSFLKNDALIGMYASIEQWFEEVGKKHLKDANDAQDDERYQELGLRSMRVIADLLKNDKYSHLSGAIDTFKKGTTGSGHFKHEDGKKQDRPSVAASGSTTTSESGGGEKAPVNGKAPQKDNPGHHPGSVIGPRGKKRAVVKNDSLGLQYSYEALEGTDSLWELDAQNGILYFNTRHNIWEECDENKSDSRVMQLQEFITIQALALMLQPEIHRSQFRRAADDITESFAFLIKNSDSFTRRRNYAAD